MLPTPHPLHVSAQMMTGRHQRKKTRTDVLNRHSSLLAGTGYGVTLLLPKECEAKPQLSTNLESKTQKPQAEKRVKVENYTEVPIPAGSFQMGCLLQDKTDCDEDKEPPMHKVTLSTWFFLITWRLQQETKGEQNTAKITTVVGLPRKCVSWYDSVRFANALSKKENLETCYQIETVKNHPHGQKNRTRGGVCPQSRVGICSQRREIFCLCGR